MCVFCVEGDSYPTFLVSSSILFGISNIHIPHSHAVYGYLSSPWFYFPGSLLIPIHAFTRMYAIAPLPPRTVKKISSGGFRTSTAYSRSVRFYLLSSNVWYASFPSLFQVLDMHCNVDRIYIINSLGILIPINYLN